MLDKGLEGYSGPGQSDQYDGSIVSKVWIHSIYFNDWIKSWAIKLRCNIES